MFTLLKGASIKTSIVVILTVIVILSTSTAFFYKSNKNTQLDNKALVIDNMTLQKNEDFTTQSSVITDKVVGDYVAEVKESNVITERLRKESIHAYVKKVEPVKLVIPLQADPTIGAERVGLLAVSMHENYCRARPKDTICNTDGIGK